MLQLTYELCLQLAEQCYQKELIVASPFQMTVPVQDISSCMQGFRGFTFVQWDEVAVHYPFLFMSVVSLLICSVETAHNDLCILTFQSVTQTHAMKFLLYVGI